MRTCPLPSSLAHRAGHWEVITMNGVQNLCHSGQGLWGAEGRRGPAGPGGSAGRLRCRSVDHGEPREARVVPVSAEPSASPTAGAEAKPGRLAKGAPRRRLRRPGLDRVPSQPRCIRCTEIAPVDSKPGQREAALVSGRGERSSRGGAPHKSPNQARETSGNHASFPRWPRGCQNY